MNPTDQLKHMLFALHNHEPDAFEDELQEIVLAIKENKFYDNCPDLSKVELIEVLDSILDTLSVELIQERALRLTVREIILNEQ
jgi:hypothetical protein